MTAAAPAGATPPPQHEFISDPAWFQQFAWDQGIAASFTIHETALSGRWNKTTFFDADGDPVLVMEHYTFVGSMENTSTGQTLTDRFDTNFKPIIRTPDGFAYDVYTAAGTTFHFTLPGQGLSQPTLVGRYVYSTDSDIVLFSAGPHPDDVYAFDQFDPTSFCSLLA